MKKRPYYIKDHDAWFLNYHKCSKTQKLKLYKDALEFACEELAKLCNYSPDVESRRRRFLLQAIEEEKNMKN